MPLAYLRLNGRTVTREVPQGAADADVQAAFMPDYQKAGYGSAGKVQRLTYEDYWKQQLANQGSITNAPPATLGQKINEYAADKLGPVMGKRFAQKAADLIDYSPVGVGTQAFQIGQDARHSKYGSAAANALGTLADMAPVGKVAHSIIAPLWHGSPHKFEKFMLDKIGTGEGAQAYGHGLYFAENPTVAKEYAQNLGRSVNLKGVSFNPNGTPNRAGYVAELLDSVGPGRIDDIQEGLRVLEPRASEKQIAEWLAEGQAQFKAADTGHLYEVKLDANPEDFLDWDKVAEDQADLSDKLLPNYVGLTGQLYNDFANSLGKFPGDPMGRMRSAEEARKRGVAGIRYLDQGSRGAGNGTRNYVVFDPSIIDITNRF